MRRKFLIRKVLLSRDVPVPGCVTRVYRETEISVPFRKLKVAKFIKEVETPQRRSYFRTTNEEFTSKQKEVKRILDLKRFHVCEIFD